MVLVAGEIKEGQSRRDNRRQLHVLHFKLQEINENESRWKRYSAKGPLTVNKIIIVLQEAQVLYSRRSLDENKI